MAVLSNQRFPTCSRCTPEIANTPSFTFSSASVPSVLSDIKIVPGPICIPDQRKLGLPKLNRLSLPGRISLGTFKKSAVIPSFPGGPVGPISPFGPVSPLGPDSPFSPFGPMGPAGPGGPVSPFGPGFCSKLASCSFREVCSVKIPASTPAVPSFTGCGI